MELTADIGIIGGTGLYETAIISDVEKRTVNTVYGDALVLLGNFNDKKIAFMPRHGKGHALPPHLVNYRANILAMEKLGVKCILSTAAVGSLNSEMKPGDLVILDQFIDFTKIRPLTFFEGGEDGVVHADMTDPYCSEIRSVLKNAGKDSEARVHDKGIYICTEGPRFETSAEIRMLRKMGGDLVGMTNVPEVVLAREKHLCYATISIVTNFAAGISTTVLSHSEVLEAMKKSVDDVWDVFERAIDHLPVNGSCSCRQWIR